MVEAKGVLPDCLVVFQWRHSQGRTVGATDAEDRQSKEHITHRLQPIITHKGTLNLRGGI